VYRKAGNSKTVGREPFESVQFFDLAISDMPSRLVTLPDDAWILLHGETPRSMHEGASQLQASVTTTLTARVVNDIVVSCPMPQPDFT
jgi:hypothetical protein